MSPFGDDFFDEIEKAFFGNQGRGRTSSYGNVIQSEKEERFVDYIECEEEVYFVFEFPGFDENDISVSLKGDNLKIEVSKKDFSGIKSYLKTKLSEPISFSKNVPVKVKKDFEKNFKNGILEVRLKRK